MRIDNLNIKKFYMSVLLESFIEPFKHYVEEEDRIELDILLHYSDQEDWKNGPKSKACTHLIEKYFDVEVIITPVIIPGCWGGVFVALITYNDRTLLENIIDKLGLDKNEIEIKEWND